MALSELKAAPRSYDEFASLLAKKQAKPTRAPTPPAFKSLDNKRILCPVLAAMVRAGDLHPDKYGSVTLEDIYSGLHNRIGAEKKNALFQATGISAYTIDEKENRRHRDRCLPNTWCFWKKTLDGKATAKTRRYVNIYKMNGMEATVS